MQGGLEPRRIRILLRCAVVAGFLVIAMFSADALWTARISAERTATRHDLHRIVQALHQYHDSCESFPPAFVIGPDGRRWHSWRALILPWLEPELARRYRFDEPWDGPSNSQLLSKAPEVFRSDSVRPPDRTTSYFAVVGKQTMWPAHQSTSMRNIMDGSSNTIAVVEDSATDVGWLEPRDMMPAGLLTSFRSETQWHTPPGRFVGLVDGSVRFLSSRVDRGVLAGLLTPSMGSHLFKGDDWPDDLIEPAGRQRLREPVDSVTLTGTSVVASAAEKIDPARNQIWAATFQLAWDELRKQAGDPVQLDEPRPVADLLNAHPFDRSSLSADSSFTTCRPVSERDDRELRAELEARFPEVRLPFHELNPPPSGWGLRLYAVIRKEMPFESVFERNREPLAFAGTHENRHVVSFGYAPSEEHHGHAIFPDQVSILDDRGDKDVIVALDTVGPDRDRIILAMVPPEESLLSTWEVVEGRIQSPNPAHERTVLDSNETLQIPILDFSLQKSFRELEGCAVQGFPDPARLVLAFVDIRLRLDETGADFLSAGEVGVVGEFGDYNPHRVRQLVFDRSFLVAMKEYGGNQPWFLAWIANAELMEEFSEPGSARP